VEEIIDIHLMLTKKFLCGSPFNIRLVPKMTMRL